MLPPTPPLRLDAILVLCVSTCGRWAGGAQRSGQAAGSVLGTGAVCRQALSELAASSSPGYRLLCTLLCVAARSHDTSEHVPHSSLPAHSGQPADCRGCSRSVAARGRPPVRAANTAAACWRASLRCLAAAPLAAACPSPHAAPPCGPHDCLSPIRPGRRCSSIKAAAKCCRWHQRPSRQSPHACRPCQRRACGPHPWPRTWSYARGEEEAEAGPDLHFGAWAAQQSAARSEEQMARW